jgi:hypothetical protein
MASPYDPNAFASRVNLACAYISAGRRNTRTFDTCFEMHDGDAVAVAVYRRSRRNPALCANLYRYLDRGTLVRAAWQNRRRSTRSLPAWAAELRRKSEETFAAMMAKQAAEKAARQAATAAAGYSVEELPRGGYSRWRFIRPDGTAGPEEYHNDNAWYAASLDLARRVESEAA